MNVRHDMIAVFVVRPDERGNGYEFLQLHRASSEYMAGVWGIIRGGVEPGEAGASAALRELREESGLTPGEFFRLGTVETFYLDAGDAIWHSAAFCAIVSRDQGVVLNEEHVEHRWVHRDRIDAETMWASERIVLRDLCRDILDGGIARPHLRIPLGGS
jgi:dihydroneopterin triphosphate diphosphatase